MKVMVRRLPLNRINPFDQVHRKAQNEYGFLCQDWQDTVHHWEGIQHARQLIRDGAMMRPIVVMPTKISPFSQVCCEDYHRLDGFKRYWAHKLEGKESIDCLIVDQYAPGAQHEHPMTCEESEWETFTTS